MDAAVWDIGYLIASILFILGLKKLGHPRTAPTGNLYGAAGMLLAIVVTICLLYTSPSPRDLSTSRMPSSA